LDKETQLTEVTILKMVECLEGIPDLDKIEQYQIQPSFPYWPIQSFDIKNINLTSAEVMYKQIQFIFSKSKLLEELPASRIFKVMTKTKLYNPVFYCMTPLVGTVKIENRYYGVSLDIQNLIDMVKFNSIIDLMDVLVKIQHKTKKKDINY